MKSPRHNRRGLTESRGLTGTNKLQIHVGDSFEDTKRRALDAVARHQRGDTVEEHHLSFENWQAFARVMTANRLELLHHVHRDPPRSIHALAAALGRDYRRVHEDVEALVAAGLLLRDEAGLRAEYDTIQIAI
jgi:predicted transcriptional regulator